ncbi:hypothetical protein TNCV_1058671 [Trichonephila clavipes]|nr:hypothetical protein TNCV_1058671 [Trichonephila clavipes]
MPESLVLSEEKKMPAVCGKYRIQRSSHSRQRNQRGSVCLRLECRFPRFPKCQVPEFQSVPVLSSTILKCIMVFLLREGKDVLLEVAKELKVEVDITLPKIEFKRRICQSKYYDEESVKYLLEGILEERDQEFEERRLARERLRAQLRMKWTNVFPPSEVRGRGTEKNNICKIEEGKEFNVYRSSDCEVKVKAGFCEGRVDAVAMGAQRVINPDNIGVPLLN